MRPNQNLYFKILLIAIAAVAIGLIVLGGILAGWDFSFLISEQAQAAYAVTVAIVLVVAMFFLTRNRHV